MLLAVVIGFLFLRMHVGAEQCLPSNESRNARAENCSGFDDEIIIQVSDNVLHQITSRIFGIFLTEIYNYHVCYEEIKYPAGSLTEKRKLYETLEQIENAPRPVVNLGVWMPADYHMPEPSILMLGRLSTGRFGWFVPKKLVDADDSKPIIPYTIFQNSSSDQFEQFFYDQSILKDYKTVHEHIPRHCLNERCITLISGHLQDTKFAIEHINEFKLYVKVLWFGDLLRLVTQKLLNRFNEDNSSSQKAFIVLHWTPSEIIDDDIEYEQISLPQCEDFSNERSQNTMCKYELTPILKYSSKELTKIIDTKSIDIEFERSDERFIFQLYNKYYRMSNWTQSERYAMYDKIACEFVTQNEYVQSDWMERRAMATQAKHSIYIGGIYPKKEESEEEHFGILTAVKMAKEAIKANKSILSDVNLVVIDNNDGCHLDTVMRTFINYYVRPEGVLGILGPPCSDSVEPVAALSKHIHMAVISYSAEGVSLKDREKYPYFFRTIGENRQYEQAYVRLLKALNWHRIVAFTEDGSKYTEYISQLENVLKENGIELTNKKFSRYFSATKMRSSLQDLKNKNSNIIIADLYDEQAGMVLCEAYKLQMSAKYGYVWFLPIWLHKATGDLMTNGNCTREQIDEMLNGHFSISHASYARDDSIMQTNTSVGEWKKSFNNETNKNFNKLLVNSSHYSGYAYDAVWVYALALDKLIKESPKNLATLHSQNTTERYKTTKRFIQIISETNFDGVSGHIQFNDDGARFATVNIMQWLNNETNLVGSFTPNIQQVNNTRMVSGGKFEFDTKKIKWFTPNRIQPHDGTNVCSVGGFAKLLGYDCSHTMLVLTAFLCLLLVILISAASFVFWKRRYDKKLKASAKLMRNFGIDLLSMSSMIPHTLDKFEISKDHVVINRRLGEGAFGTVYGGEAQIDDHGWTAVAVKTLKKGSNTEDRLDFLSESEAMKRFDHSNVIKLLGVCLQTEPIYAVMEFMLYGDLKTFLLARRHLVNEKSHHHHHHHHDDSDISSKRLTMMALDIARALAYLTEMKYVHRDVACRNCLVNAQRVVKLGDFGMARSTSENDYYRFSRKGMLPVRWMAPESLSLGKFTPASDIWSYGVLLFEIITFGSFPFQGMTNNQVLEYLKEGNTLTIPHGIKPQLEGLMKACWNLSYTKRPTASEVVDFISNYPKLVTPSLDVPLASVQIPENSDQLELLPGLHKINTPTEDFHNQPSYNNLTISNGITLSEFTEPLDEPGGNSPTRNPSITQPLLMYEDDKPKNDNTLPQYVPMNGNRNGINMSNCVNAVS